MKHGSEGNVPEILAELPLDVSEAEAEEALESTIEEGCWQTTNVGLRKNGRPERPSVINHALAELKTYMLELRCEGEISDEEYWSRPFTADLKEAVRCGLESELTGDETAQEARDLARNIIDESLEA
jgi:hypothetical protein